MIRLRKLEGINRPAIAVLWPSRSKVGFNIVLDVGADIKAEANDLLQYALMGVSYARNGLNVDRPKVGLLNVGTEEHKGRAELHRAHELIEKNSDGSSFSFVFNYRRQGSAVGRWSALWEKLPQQTQTPDNAAV